MEGEIDWGFLCVEASDFLSSLPFFLCRIQLQVLLEQFGKRSTENLTWQGCLSVHALRRTRNRIFLYFL